MAVKLDKESGCVIDDAVEMREVMVHTESDRCTLVIDMTINNHYVEAVVDSGTQVSVLSRRFYDSLSCRPRPVESIRLKGPRRWPWKLQHDNVCDKHYRQLYSWFGLSKGP